MDQILEVLTQKVLNLQDKQLVHIKAPVLRRTIARLPDVLLAEKDEHTGRYIHIYHIEVHLKDEAEIAYRAAEYAVMEFREYKCPISIYVLYIGNGKSKNIPSSLYGGFVQTQIALVQVNELPINDFLSSTHPAEVLLSILANFGEQNPPEAIYKIVRRLREVTDTKENLEKYCKHLEILSNIRNLQPETIKAISIMPIIYDIKTDMRYQQGHEEGLMEGIEKGIEKGREEGISLKERDFTLRLWEMQEFPFEKIALLVGINEQQVLDIISAALQEKGQTTEEIEGAIVAYREKCR